MANLNGQTIRGTNNYKGLLNLDSTIGTPLDATLRAVTDGAGTASLLQLSTEAVGLSRTVNLSAGATTPRLFNVAYTINNSGAQTGTLTGLFLNATETALNGITHNLLDLQVGGVSRFLVNNFGNGTFLGSVVAGGNVIVGAGANLNIGNSGKIQTPADGVFLISNNAVTTFNRLQLGGTTSSFPAIKRNGAAINLRLADDSAYCDLIAANIQTSGGSIVSGGSISWSSGAINSYTSGSNIRFTDASATNFTGLFAFGQLTSAFPAIKRALNNVEIKNADDTFGAGISVGGTLVASAILQADSTTKGFLMPRMTQAQILLIATPAAGLQVYNTDLNQPCFYDGTAWRRVSHSTM